MGSHGQLLSSKAAEESWLISKDLKAQGRVHPYAAANKQTYQVSSVAKAGNSWQISSSKRQLYRRNSEILLRHLAILLAKL